MNGLIGKKVGMTEVWDAEGRRVAVTVIEAGPCPVVQVKTEKTDGYNAVQVGFIPQKPQRLSKAERVRYEKANVDACRTLREFDPENDEFKVGDAITVDKVFDGVKTVDITAMSKGRGFAGVVRRYRMGGGPFTHGGHSKRRIGSIGERDLPGWIRKGKSMPGHMGAVKVTTRNLTVVAIRKEDNAILVRGAVPGPAGATVIIRKSL